MRFWSQWILWWFPPFIDKCGRQTEEAAGHFNFARLRTGDSQIGVRHAVTTFTHITASNYFPLCICLLYLMCVCVWTVCLTCCSPDAHRDKEDSREEEQSLHDDDDDDEEALEEDRENVACKWDTILSFIFNSDFSFLLAFISSPRTIEEESLFTMLSSSKQTRTKPTNISMQ